MHPMNQLRKKMQAERQRIEAHLTLHGWQAIINVGGAVGMRAVDIGKCVSTTIGRTGVNHSVGTSPLNNAWRYGEWHEVDAGSLRKLLRRARDLGWDHGT